MKPLSEVGDMAKALAFLEIGALVSSFVLCFIVERVDIGRCFFFWFSALSFQRKAHIETEAFSSRNLKWSASPAYFFIKYPRIGFIRGSTVIERVGAISS